MPQARFCAVDCDGFVVRQRALNAPLPTGHRPSLVGHGIWGLENSRCHPYAGGKGCAEAFSMDMSAGHIDQRFNVRWCFEAMKGEIVLDHFITHRFEGMQGRFAVLCSP